MLVNYLWLRFFVKMDTGFTRVHIEYREGNMAWCPICRAEYREGFNVCSTCKCQLEETLVEEEEEAEQVVDISEDNLEYILNVRDEIEASLIESILNGNGIAVVKKYCDAGGYVNIYMGTSATGMDIYVSRKNYEIAKEIIKADVDVANREELEETEEEKAIFKEEKKLLQKKRSIKAWIALLFLIPGIAIIIYAAIYGIIRILFK